MWTQYDCGYHGNLVTIAARYVIDAYLPKGPPYQIWTQSKLRQKRVIDISLWLPC